MDKFIKFIKDNKLIYEGDGIVVGLSGGPDSVCLLHLLNSVRDKLKIRIVAAHINHMIRGCEADADELYCKNICESLNIEFFSERIEVEKYAKENGISSEMAGRDIRYKFFNKVLEKNNFNKIATAHNANDQAETILMRIMRGTALEGLAGIPVKRDGKYIRPILFMKRELIEDYCEVNKLNPRIDKTNMERIYSRNKVRLDILPYMKENFNPDIIETINRMAGLLQSDNEFIQEYANDIYEKKCEKKKGSIVIKEAIFEYNKSILTRIVRKVLMEVSEHSNDFEMKHIFDVIGLQKMGTNKKVDLPNNIYAENVYGDIYVRIKKEEEVCVQEEIVITKEELLKAKEVTFNGDIISFELISKNEMEKNNDNNSIKYFNYDEINGNISIRRRKNGDKMIPLGMKGKKKIKDIFIDMKIPAEERSLIPIIQFEEEIAWIVGIKVSEVYKVTKECNKILRIMFTRKEL